MTTYIDSHVHVYDSTRAVLPLGDPIPHSEASAASLQQDMARAGVGGAVLVQPSVYGRDHSWLSSVLSGGGAFAGVGLIDASAVAAAEVAAEVERLEALGLSGIRIHLSEEMMPVAQQAAISAGRLGLVLDVHVQEPVWPLLWEIADAPGAPQIVVDHFGRPGDPSSAEAARFLVSMRDREHMLLKVSGLEVISKQGFPYLDMKPLFEQAVTVLGSGRLMWASNFPYCRGAAYDALFRQCQEYLPLDDTTRDDIMGATARRVFSVRQAVS